MMSWISWRMLPAFHESAGCVHREGSDLDISVSLIGPGSVGLVLDEQARLEAEGRR